MTEITNIAKAYHEVMQILTKYGVTNKEVIHLVKEIELSVMHPSKSVIEKYVRLR